MASIVPFNRTLSLLEQTQQRSLELAQERQDLVATEKQEVGRLQTILKQETERLQALSSKEAKIKAADKHSMCFVEGKRDELTLKLEELRKQVLALTLWTPELQRTQEIARSQLLKLHPEQKSQFPSTP